MSISVQCPACKKNLKTKDELAGKRVKCPGCGYVILVPAAQPESQPKAIKPSQANPPVPKKAEAKSPPPSRTPSARAADRVVPGKPSFWGKPLFGTGRVRKDSPEDRGDLWAQITGNREPEVQMIFDLVAFPGAQFEHLALVGEAHFTDTGIFIIGLARLDNSKAKPVKLGGAAFGAVFLLGGAVGVMTQGMEEARQAKAAIKAMKRQYQVAAHELGTTPLASRFAAAPSDVYHFTPEEIEEVVITQTKDQPSHVRTVFGLLELPLEMTEEQREALCAWKEQFCPVVRPGTTSGVWTFGKAALYIRKNNDLDERLLHFLVEAGSDPVRSQQLCQVLSNGLHRTRYWTFVGQVATGGESGGTALAAVTAKHQRRKAFWKIPSALLCFLAAFAIVGVCILGMSTGEERPWSGDQKVFLASIVLGALLFLLGIALTYVAIGDYARSRPYLVAGQARTGSGSAVP